jgi:ABC-type antimicrobial peptide transport system permease subunit
MVLWQNARVILAGVAAGVLCSLVLGQGLSRLLFGVSAHDPLVIGLVPLILLAVALAASYLPALRASRINPISALRCE